MKKFLYIAILLTSQFANAENISSKGIEERLEKMERGMADLQRELYQNNKKSQAGETNPDVAGNVESRLSELEEQMRHLNGKVEEAVHQTNLSDEKFQNMKKDFEFRLEEISEKIENLGKAKGDPAAVKTQSAEAVKPKKAVTEKEIKEQYDEAFNVLKDGNYEKSELLFKEFIKNYEEHELTGSAYYWLAENYLALGNKDSAALNFLYSYKKFPKGAKAPNSLYKLGVTLAKIGKKKEACDSFGKLLESYPKLQMELKTDTNSEMKQLGCKKPEVKKSPSPKPKQ